MVIAKVADLTGDFNAVHIRHRQSMIYGWKRIPPVPDCRARRIASYRKAGPFERIFQLFRSIFVTVVVKVKINYPTNKFRPSQPKQSSLCGDVPADPQCQADNKFGAFPVLSELQWFRPSYPRYSWQWPCQALCPGLAADSRSPVPAQTEKKSLYKLGTHKAIPKHIFTRLKVHFTALFVPDTA